MSQAVLKYATIDFGIFVERMQAIAQNTFSVILFKLVCCVFREYSLAQGMQMGCFDRLGGLSSINKGPSQQQTICHFI